jgi:hypothetical protein
MSYEEFYAFISDYAAMTGIATNQVEKGMEDGEPYRAWVVQGKAPDPIEIGRFTPSTGLYHAHMKFIVDIQQAERCVRCHKFLKPHEGYEFEAAFGEKVPRSAKPFKGLHCDGCFGHIHRKNMVDSPRPVVRTTFVIESVVKK